LSIIKSMATSGPARHDLAATRMRARCDLLHAEPARGPARQLDLLHKSGFRFFACS
jgi:hypothetical protein